MMITKNLPTGDSKRSSQVVRSLVVRLRQPWFGGQPRICTSTDQSSSQFPLRCTIGLGALARGAVVSDSYCFPMAVERRDCVSINCDTMTLSRDHPLAFYLVARRLFVSSIGWFHPLVLGRDPGPVVGHKNCFSKTVNAHRSNSTHELEITSPLSIPGGATEKILFIDLVRSE
jgi:hypothetical protein